MAILCNFKKIIYRSTRYLQFIRQQKCIVCSSCHSEPHHIQTAGKGIKCSDLLTVPLCRFHHTECHTIGRKTFQEKHNIDFKEEVIKYMKMYIEKLERGEE
jgi:hypothetical protein